MRVLIAHPGAELYGSDRMAIESARALLAGGHAVVLVTPHRGPLTELAERNGIEVRYCDVPVLRKSDASVGGLLRLARRTLVSFARAVRLVRQLRTDVLLVNTIVQPAWMIAGRLARVGVVVHIRESEDSSSKIMRSLLLAPVLAADLIVANSQATAEFVRRSLGRVSPNTRVVYNGKDWSGYFVEDADYVRFPTRIALIGRLSPRKGQDVALEALKLLVDDGRDVQMTIVGEVFEGYEWYRSTLEEYVRLNDLESVCTFAGFQSDVAPYLRACEFVIVPSRTEPFGTVALEAMAAKRCVLVANIGGLPEIVSRTAENAAGVIVEEPDDPAAWATALSSLMDEPDLARQIATTGFERVHQQFGRESYESGVRAAVAAAYRRGVGRG